MIEINNLVTGYGKQRVLNRINLKFQPGDFSGILGPNGAGKSTLFRTLIRIIPVWKGSIRILGRDLKIWDHKALARKLALIPQEMQLQFDYKVRDLILMGRFPYLGYFQNYSEKDHYIVEQVMEQLDIKIFAEKIFSELSGGEKQRVSIARALVQKSDILLVDEAFSGLDIDHQLEFVRILSGINRDQNKTIILISHNINLLADYCKRLLLLKNGEVIAEGIPTEIMTTQNLRKLYSETFPIIVNKNTGRPNMLYPGNNEI